MPPAIYIRRATKIVATLGPASSDVDTLAQMIATGVNVVRLNFSHGTAQEHMARAEAVREASRRAGREVAIMADLQGPKIRVGQFAEGKVYLAEGATFVLDAARTAPGDAQAVGLDYKELPQDVRAGDVLLLNDGLIVLRVVRVLGDAVHTEVVVGGELSNNKGINKQGGGLTAPALTAKDMEDIKTAIQLGADYVAVSFPKNATDMEMARQLCTVAAAGTGHRPGLIAKMERAEAIPHLEDILRVSDGIMVARGDLAVEVGNAAVPALQKKMIRMARAMDKLVITATQMMESMITNALPTRAEVSDAGQRRAGRYRCRHAQRRNGDWQIPPGDGARDGPHLRRCRGGGRCQWRCPFHPAAPHTHRPIHCSGRIVYRPPPGRQGDCGDDGQRLDRTVDEPPPHPYSHLRPHAQGRYPAQDGAVPQRQPPADGYQRRA